MKLKKIAGFFFPSSSTWGFWLCMGLFFKGVLFFIQIHDHSVDNGYPIPGFIGGSWGDTQSYLVPIDNLLSGKGYTPDFRLPGYGIVYLPFALLFSKGGACNVLIFIQFIVSSISVYALALSVKNIFKSNVFFYITFYLYAISSFSNCYDSILLTESLTTSFLVFSIYFFSRYLIKGNRRYVLLSGFFLAWVIFLRPVFVPLLAVLFVLMFINTKKITIAVLILIPFLLFDGVWVIRNYSLYKKIIPFTKSLHYFGENSYYPYVFTFCAAWGGCHTDGQTYLLPELSNDNFKPNIPDYIYTSKFNFDSIHAVRELIKKVTSDSSGVPQKQQDVYTEKIKQKLTQYAQSIKNEKPFLYYIKGPSIALEMELSITYFSVVFLNNYTIMWCKICYYFTMISGFIGAVLMLIVFKKNLNSLMFVIIPLYTMVIHGIILRVGENRYIVPSYPFIVVCAAYAIYSIYLSFFSEKQTNE